MCRKRWVAGALGLAILAGACVPDGGGGEAFRDCAGLVMTDPEIDAALDRLERVDELAHIDELVTALARTGAEAVTSV